MRYSETMRRSALFLGLIAWATLHGSADAQHRVQADASTLLSKAARNLSSQMSIRYEVRERLKYYSGTDTLSKKTNVSLVRHAADTVAGAYLHLERSDSSAIIWNGSLLAFVQHDKRTITTYDYANGETWMLDNYITGEQYLHPDRLNHLLDDYDCLGVSETRIGGDDVYELRLYGKKEDVPDSNAEVIRQSRVLRLRRSDLSPVSETSIYKFQGEYQFTELTFSRIRFGGITRRDLTKKYPYGYTQARYEYLPIMPLDSGSAAPLITGQRIIDGTVSDALDTVRFEGKVTLLDFWYMSCAPCIMAIPAMDSIRAELPRDSFQIISVNSIDGNANGRRRLPSFMKFNPMSTHVLLVDAKVPQSYRVNVYPLFFIVDGSGMIRYYNRGFSARLKQELTRVMRECTLH